MTTILIIVFSIGLVIAASLLFILMINLNRINKSSRLLKTFDKAASERGLAIKRQDVLGNGIIGLDDQQNKLLFLDASTDKYRYHLIHLEEIQSCSIQREYGYRSTKRLLVKNAEAYVTRIILQLDDKTGLKSYRLPFYNLHTNPLLEKWEASERAKEWQALLSSSLIASESGPITKKMRSEKVKLNAVETDASLR